MDNPTQHGNAANPAPNPANLGANPPANHAANLGANLAALDREFVLHTYARDYTHFTHGKAARIYTAAGEDYIDFAAGIGVNSLGHAHPALVGAIADQAAKIIHNSNLFLIEPQARLAEKLCALVGYPARSFFCNSGLEANECAIKIARKYGESSGRFEIITLKNSFHGRSIATLTACAQDKMHTHFAPFLQGFIYAADIKDAIKIAKENDRVVAILLELIQGEGGVRAFETAELRDLREFCTAQDVLLMIDEVQSGVFRSGEFLAAQKFGIVGDVVTLAKGLAGGVPIGAAITTKIDVFSPSDHGSTFGGNFLATNAALCALEVLKNHKDSGALAENIALFDFHLEGICRDFGEIFSATSGVGFMRGLKAKNDEILGAIIEKTRQKRLILLKSGNATLRFLPPIVIAKDEIEEGFRRLRAALEAI